MDSAFLMKIVRPLFSTSVYSAENVLIILIPINQHNVDQKKSNNDPALFYPFKNTSHIMYNVSYMINCVTYCPNILFWYWMFHFQFVQITLVSLVLSVISFRFVPIARFYSCVLSANKRNERVVANIFQYI